MRLRLTRDRRPPDAPFGADFDAIFAARIARGRRVLRHARHAGPLARTPRAVQRQAFAGLLWSQAVLPLRRRPLAARRPGQAPRRPPERLARPQPRLDAPLQRRRHLDAGQVGVPLVRRLGPRLPLRPAGARRPRLRQGAARPAAARVVHAPERPAARPTSGPSATSTRRSTPGRPGASTRSTRSARGRGDRAFLERVFHKLLLNFTWWVNRKDAEGNNVFQGGFLGLDNIGVFDRSAPLPTGGHLEQSDGTSWMGMYCLNMLAIALELAQRRTRPTRTSPPSSSSTSSTSAAR